MWSESCRIFNVWDALNEKPRIIDAVEEKEERVGLFTRISRLFQDIMPRILGYSIAE